MTQTTNRPFATVLALAVAAALWLPTLTVPQPQPAYAQIGASAPVELA